MYRTEINSLIRWKKSKTRKPLIIRGARQVGKTWLMKEFGKEEYNQTVYINFESSSHLIDIFNADFDIQRVITALQIETGIIANNHDTLIIFDEIQEAPKAITSLKYFLLLSKDLNYININEYSRLKEKCVLIAKQLNGLINSLKRKNK